MSRLEGLLLDLDGVLVDSQPAHLWAWTELLRGEGVAFSAADYRRVGAGRPREAVIQAMLGAVAPEEHERLMRLKAALVERYVSEHGLEPIPGALDFVCRARGSRVPVAVATSSRAPALLLGAIGATHHFEVVVDRTMVTRGKPWPDLYLLAARRLGADPHGCWVVEDAPAGVEAGLAAGCHVLAVTTTHQRDALSRAHLVVDGYDEVCLADLADRTRAFDGTAGGD